MQVILAARHKPGKKGQIDETRRFITYCLDHTIASATTGADKFVTLFDLTGGSCSFGPYASLSQYIACLFTFHRGMVACTA